MHSGHARCLIRRSSASVWFLVTSSTLFAQGTTPSTLTPASTPAHQIFDLSVFVVAVTGGIFLVVGGLLAVVCIGSGQRRPIPRASRLKSTAAHKLNWRGL